MRTDERESEGFFRRALRAFTESDAGRYDAIIRMRTYGRSGSVLPAAAAVADENAEDGNKLHPTGMYPPLRRVA
ncbi:MAG: hypothetical protein GC168_11760 [Candidatus Hydrogenedens sp.]|nr:hypothetical protein [Candidatus Hydrogenedens sp.]